jgi:hypothetical protein
MELCKNGLSVRMGFFITRKADGQHMAIVSAIIPIAEMDNENAWWKYGVLAYLHDRRMATHDSERNLYCATAQVDHGTRHAFVRRAQAERTARLQQKCAERLERREAKIAETARRNAAKKEASKAEAVRKKAEKKGAKIAQKQRFEPVSIELMPAVSGSVTCSRCGYHDPNGSGVACPNCEN